MERCNDSTNHDNRPCHRTWLGLLTGGRSLRNSACCFSASFRCRASRDSCSGSGPGLEQPKKRRVNVGIKNMSVVSFFIEKPQHNPADECGNVSRMESLQVLSAR